MPESTVATSTPPTPRVFISYSWTSQEHVDWVLALAERLMGDGVDVVIDKWDLKEGQDKYHFMERMVTDQTVTRVLAIVDRVFAEKADGRLGGVGTESQIISKEVYEQVGQEKFIALARELKDNGKPWMPVYFGSRVYIDFCDDDKLNESHDQLIRNLFGRPERAKPPLGQPPAHLFVTDAPHVNTAGKLQTLKDAVTRQKPHTQALLQDYLDVLLAAMEDFRIGFKGDKQDPPFDEVVVSNVTSFVPYRDNFVDLVLFVANYMNEDESWDRFFEFWQEILSFKFHRPAPGLGTFYEIDEDNYVFIIRELFLYFIAALIKSKRYETAARFIEAEYSYLDTSTGSTYRHSGIVTFDGYSRVLEQMRNGRLKLNLISVSGSLIETLAKHPKISFRDIVQADLILYLRHFFPQPGGSGGWHPRTIPYAGRFGTLELFAKASTDLGFRALQQLLKVKTRASLLESIQTMIRTREFQDIMASSRFMMAIRWNELLGLDHLGGSATS